MKIQDLIHRDAGKIFTKVLSADTTLKIIHSEKQNFSKCKNRTERKFLFFIFLQPTTKPPHIIIGEERHTAKEKDEQTRVCVMHCTNRNVCMCNSDRVLLRMMRFAIYTYRRNSTSYLSL